MYLLLELLNKTKEMNASDLHLTVGLAPTIRCNGKLIQLGIDKLSSNDLERFSREILQEKYDEYIEIGEFDTSYSVEGVGRFRINVFKEKNNDAIAIRVIALKIPTLNELNHPEVLKSIINKKRGLILVTGPTGSGKSTTLYTVLSELNTDDVNIVTVEDPVEYSLSGINQVSVNNKAGLTFASGLRSILRQDPDIIMIGEIRDNETAEIAIKAAITGHLVLSTLHTNDAPSSISRLLDMGIEPYLVSTSLVGVIAQRLVRRICPNCKEEYEASEKEKKILHKDLDMPLKLYRGKGCGHCNKTGYYGRAGIYEIMEVTREHRDAMNTTRNMDTFRDISLKHGMTTLEDECIKLVLNGTTTVEELATISLMKEDM